MNAKGTRKVLNEAFKQFQRLPDWPLAREEDRFQRDRKDEAKEQSMLTPFQLAQAAHLSQCLAE